ncbi:MAG: zf-HC2 domain-containing protein [Acidobacteriia bacterium]|nr:zf-HC2 domain-containing protein [Terriglobia bacterium]
MKCDQVRKMIEDYHYEELDERQAAEVAAHLRECGSCRRELDVLEGESRIYEAYAAKAESALEVPPDLWRRAAAGQALRPAGGKQHSISPARRLSALLPARAWVRQALAAVLLVAISITGTLILVEHYRVKHMTGSRQEVAPAGDTGDASLDAALESIQRAEQEYLKAIRELSVIVEKQKSTLDPRILAELQTNLKLIDDHIAATRKAYYAHPRDAELALYMLAAYNRKVELLQDLTS